MKRSVLIIAGSLMITSSIISSCASPSEKVENAQDKLEDANKDLDNANKEYLMEIETYRKEIADKVAANEKSIEEFKNRKEVDKGIAKAEYQKKLAELEQKNSDMKKKMDDYKADGKEKWELFKTEFGQAMDALGKSFSDLTHNKSK